MEVQNQNITPKSKSTSPVMGIRKIKAFRKDPLVLAFYHFIHKDGLRKKGIEAVERHLLRKQNEAKYEELVQ